MATLKEVQKILRGFGFVCRKVDGEYQVKRGHWSWSDDRVYHTDDLVDAHGTAIHMAQSTVVLGTLSNEIEAELKAHGLQLTDLPSEILSVALDVLIGDALKLQRSLEFKLGVFAMLVNIAGLKGE